MNIVAIDTSGPVASCAVMKNGEVVHAISMNQGLTHSETIMPALDESMYAAGLDEFIGGDGVALVEWPEMADVDPQPALNIYIERMAENTEMRRIRIENDGVNGFDEAKIQNWRAE